MIRTAFERGDFQAVHRLSELAKQRDLGFVQLVSAAARIEAGEPALSVASDFDPNLSGTLSRRLAHHLATPEEQGGVLLRDRFGQPIGTTDGEALHLDEDIRYELVPRAVVDAVANHRTVGSLRLTLDLELSEAAFEAFGRYRGSIVLVDPHTGHVLAAVSDRRTWRRGGTPAFEQMREPASIAKLITTTATLRAGLQPDLELGRMRCRGHERYAGKFLYCPTIVGRLRGLDRALATSCNVAFANLGVRVGRQAMLKELGRYGFGPSSNPLAGGRILQSWGDDRQLADLSIGLEATAVTPLHAALIAAVMAANGVMPEPTLLAAEDGRLGLHPRLLPPAPGRQVIEPHWVPEMVDAMRAVVRRGTAQRVWPPSSFPVAMKTGTASDPRYGFHVNYIGIGPMPEARLAFCVRVTNQPTSAKVRYAAQQVTHRLLRNLGAIAERRGWADEAPYDELELYQRLDRLASRDLSQPATQSGLERAKRLAARR
ncbi:MAG: penicillin-binding transpeptidase domain-containing protein [Acidobacteriota bacterium]